MDTKELVVNFEEAQIIEGVLRNRELDGLRWLIIQMARILVSGQETNVGLEEKDLWFLRDFIQPGTKVGKITGLSLLIKIYVLLLEYHDGYVTELNYWPTGIPLALRGDPEYGEHS